MDGRRGDLGVQQGGRGFEWVLMKFLLCLLCALVFFLGGRGWPERQS